MPSDRIFGKTSTIAVKGNCTLKTNRNLQQKIMEKSAGIIYFSFQELLSQYYGWK